MNPERDLSTYLNKEATESEPTDNGTEKQEQMVVSSDVHEGNIKVDGGRGPIV